MGRFAACISLMGIFFVVACGSSDGEPASTGSGGSGSAGGTAGGDSATTNFAASECGQCVKQNCVVEDTACAAEPDCAGYLDCLNACPILATGALDEVCEDACPKPTSTAGKEAFGALTGCRKEGAGLECAQCGLDSILDQTCGSSTLDGCPKCEEERCCITRAACDANPGCLALIACVKGCTPGDHACSIQCYQDNETGVASLGEHLGCVFASCPASEECGPIPAQVLCIADKCANTQAACTTNLECWLTQECVGNCNGEIDCIEACIAEHPSAEQLFIEFSACALALCGSAF